MSGRGIRGLCIAAAGTVFYAFAPSAAAQGPPAAKVRVDAVRMERVAQHREVTGELRPVRRSRVAAEEAGLVLEMKVETGDRIEAGDVLAVLDDQIIRLEIEQKQAESAGRDAQIELRQAELEKANRDLERLRDLFGKQGATQNEVDDASTLVRAAEARLADAKAARAATQAELNILKQRRTDMVIKAPFSGSVVTKEIEVGEWIDEGDTAVELLELDVMDAFVDVPQRYIAAVSHAGTRVQLRIEAIDELLDATIDSIIDQADPLARTFPLRVRVNNDDGRLRPGMSVTALIPTGASAESLTVHKDAVLRDDAGTFVYFDAGGQAIPARVEPVFAVGDRVVIREGALRPGMNVVIEGNERLFPTQPLQILNPQQGEAPKGAMPNPHSEAASG